MEIMGGQDGVGDVYYSARNKMCKKFKGYLKME
jgi:hypothetical protein